MKFKTDFLAEDYSGLCWFQARPVSIILAVLLTMAISFTVFGLTKNILIGIALLIICYPLMYKFQKWNVTRRADRRFAAFGASSELELELNGNEIYQIAASGETRLPWQDVYAVRESDTSYYVFLTKGKAFYFPKRSFVSPEHRAEFLEYINKYVPASKVKLKK